MPKKILSGTVVSNKPNKTIIVKVTRQVKHPLYKNIIRKSKNYFAHDEENNYKQNKWLNRYTTGCYCPSNYRW